MNFEAIKHLPAFRLAHILALSCLAFSANAKPCTQNPASLPMGPQATAQSVAEPNMGYFVWSATQNNYVLVSSYYDPSVTSSYVPGPGEVDVTPSTAGNSVEERVGPQVSICDPPPPIVDLARVTAVPPPSIIGFKPLIVFTVVPFHAGGGGGGGRIYRKIVKDIAPDNPHNTNPATCKADSESRWYHAAMDFAAWKLTYAPKQMVGRGEVMTITYDGGGSEDYMWIPGRMPASSTPPETYILQLPGTLSCPK
jgi:hypothetical protein